MAAGSSEANATPHTIAWTGTSPRDAETETALIYDSPVTGTKRSFTFSELLDEVETFAAVLADKGVTKGDRVVIYMPMVPETLIAMLATARLGAIYSMVFGGFAANELAARIDDAKPKVVVSASCGVEPGRIVNYKPLLDAAIKIAANKPEHCIILQRQMAQAPLIKGRDYDWAELVAEAKSAGRKEPCVPVEATAPLYILYTSGTTGQPKGVVRDNGGHMVALKWSMKNIYDVKPGEVYWAASDIGWVVGHSYIVYAPLLNGNATIIYEGKPVGTPDAGAFWRVSQSTRSRLCSPRRPRFAPLRETIRKGTSSGNTISRACARCSSPESAQTPTPSCGPRSISAFRSSTIGGRPRRDGPSPAIQSASASSR